MSEERYVVVAMCVECKHRWLGYIPVVTSLFGLECPSCNIQNSFASILPDEYLEEIDRLPTKEDVLA